MKTPGEDGYWSGPRGSSKEGEAGLGVGYHRSYCGCEARKQRPALMNRSGLAKDLF